MKQTQKYTVLCSGRSLMHPFKVMAANTIKVLFHNIYKAVDPDSKGTTSLYQKSRERLSYRVPE